MKKQMSTMQNRERLFRYIQVGVFVSFFIMFTAVMEIPGQFSRELLGKDYEPSKSEFGLLFYVLILGLLIAISASIFSYPKPLRRPWIFRQSPEVIRKFGCLIFVLGIIFIGIYEAFTFNFVPGMNGEGVSLKFRLLVYVFSLPPITMGTAIVLLADKLFQKDRVEGQG